MKLEDLILQDGAGLAKELRYEREFFIRIGRGQLHHLRMKLKVYSADVLFILV